MEATPLERTIIQLNEFAKMVSHYETIPWTELHLRFAILTVGLHDEWVETHDRASIDALQHEVSDRMSRVLDARATYMGEANVANDALVKAAFRDLVDVDSIVKKACPVEEETSAKKPRVE